MNLVWESMRPTTKLFSVLIKQHQRGPVLRASKDTCSTHTHTQTQVRIYELINVIQLAIPRLPSHSGNAITHTHTNQKRGLI